MKFYCIVKKSGDSERLATCRYLRTAAEARGLEFVPLVANEFDYLDDIKTIETPSLMYRVAVGKRPSMLELLLQKQGVVGFHKDVKTLLSRRFDWGAAVQLEQAGLPSIPTIYNISRNEDAHLEKYVKHLGGFPIIVKSAGGSHGVGVMKVDSIESLRSVVAFVAGDDAADIALRTFVHDARHIRVVVVGESVADVIEYKAQEGDFRTNAVSVPAVEDRNDLEDEYRAIAVAAVKAQDIEFGGVDLLIDRSGKAYIAEVNFPCNFARNQTNTHTDIAGMMIEYLQEKAARAS